MELITAAYCWEIKTEFPTHEQYCSTWNRIPSSGPQVNFFPSLRTSSTNRHTDSSSKFACASRQAEHRSSWRAWYKKSINTPCIFYVWLRLVRCPSSLYSSSTDRIENTTYYSFYIAACWFTDVEKVFSSTLPRNGRIYLFHYSGFRPSCHNISFRQIYKKSSMFSIFRPWNTWIPMQRLNLWRNIQLLYI
jgi:hypothetical protein